MADFRTPIEGPASSNVTPASPVQDNSTATAISGVADIFSNVATGYAKKVKSDAIAKNNDVVADFSQRLLTLTDSADRGIIKRGEANLKGRSLLMQYMAQYPGSQEDLRSSWSSIVSTTKVNQPSEQEKLQMTRINNAAKDGWVKSWMSPEQQVQAADQHSRFTMLLQSQQMYRNDLATEKSEIELQEARRRNNAQIALPQIGEVYFDKFNNDMKDIMRQASEYQGPDRAKFVGEMSTNIDAQIAQVNATVNAIGAHAGGDYVRNIVNPIKDLGDLTKKFISGEINSEAYKAEVDNRNAIQTLMVYDNNPDTAKYVAVSGLMKNTPAAMIRPMETWAVSVLQANSNDTGNNGNLISDGRPTTEKGIKQYFDVINSGIDKLNSKSFQDDGQLVGELSNQVNNIIAGVSEYEGTAKDAKGFNQLVDFFASNRFKSFIEKTGGLNKDSLMAASDAISVNYTREVLPLVQREYANAVGGGSVGRAGTGRKVVSDFVEPVFTSNAMTFRMKDAVPTKERQKVVRDLNERVAPVINKIIRAQSNLSGVDAKEVYDQQILPAVFGIEPEGDESLQLPNYGDVINGYMYVGDKEADPRDSNNWEKVGG